MRQTHLFSVVLLWLVLIPIAYGRQFTKPSVTNQISLGQKVAEEIRRTEKVLPVDDPRSIVLRRVATRILGSIHDKEAWAFSFDVIDSPIVNAFALPGGPTFFYSGLMDKLKSEDELAAVLSHELTHVRMQHWATQYTSTQRRDLLLNLGLILSKANYAVSELAGLADDLVFNLPFSRSEESQADEGGLKLMTQAGYNPRAMISVFNMLSKTLGGDKGLTFLSDHPSDAKRIARIESLASQSGLNLPTLTPLTY